MLNKSDFEKIRKDLNDFEESRELLITNSRHIIKLSKQIIYSIHRGNIEEAGKLVEVIKKDIKKLPKEDYDAGMKNVALQEYAEALLFYVFAKEKRVPASAELKIDTASYLMGVCDFTGELVRRAANLVLQNKIEEAKLIRDTVDEIYGEFLKFDLRGGELRKKSDAIKHNLIRIEDILYNVSIRK